MKPFFETSDTGSKVYLLDGDPEYLEYVIPSEATSIKISLPVMLEIYRLFNGIWYGGTWKYLNICASGMCSNMPHGGHVRTETCPKMTEYEYNALQQYMGRMREMHMEENRPPIADGTTSNSSQ